MKQALSLDDVRRIKEYEYPANSVVGYARDMFLFSFYTKGMSYGDMSDLRKSDINRGMLSYQKRQKGHRIHIKWEACMQEIVDRYNSDDSIYLLPIIPNIKRKDDLRNNYKSELAKVNAHLKKLSEQLNLGFVIMMNVARHSWALAAQSKNIPIYIISESLGYNNDTETQLYLASLDHTTADEANSMILGDVVGSSK